MQIEKAMIPRASWPIELGQRVAAEYGRFTRDTKTWLRGRFDTVGEGRVRRYFALRDETGRSSFYHVKAHEMITTIVEPLSTVGAYESGASCVFASS